MANQKVYIGLGTNIGERESNLLNAQTKIKEQLQTQIICSPIYETEPWGMADQSMFLNQVVEIQTTMSPQSLLDVLLSIELEIGRKRVEKWGPRIIDLDLLLFGDVVIKSENLKIPHPEIHLRKFVLAPLCDLDANIIHPVFGNSMYELLEECPDRTKIRIHNP